MFLGLLSVGVLFVFYNNKNNSNVAFVRSQIVLEKYIGMREAKQVYQKKVDVWQSNIDSLEFNYNRSVQNYNRKLEELSESEQARLEESLRNERIQLDRYSKAIEQKATDENEKMLQGVLNQVNAYIKRYGEENDYDIILGVTLSGNILYGVDKKDITEEIITGLNKEYKGK